MALDIVAVAMVVNELEALKQTPDLSEEEHDRLNQALIPLRLILLSAPRA